MPTKTFFNSHARFKRTPHATLACAAAFFSIAPRIRPDQRGEPLAGGWPAAGNQEVSNYCRNVLGLGPRPVAHNDVTFLNGLATYL